MNIASIGHRTIDAIFIVRQLQLVFVDLEKAFNRVPREVVQWVMRKLGVVEWVVRVIMKMYEDSRTAVG